MTWASWSLSIESRRLRRRTFSTIVFLRCDDHHDVDDQDDDDDDDQDDDDDDDDDENEEVEEVGRVKHQLFIEDVNLFYDTCQKHFW